MKFAEYRDMKISLSKSKIIEALEENNVKELLVEIIFIKSLGFEENDMLSFMYQAINNTLQNVELNTLICAFNKIKECYGINLNVDSYANLSYFYINDNGSINPLKLKKYLSDDFLESCHEDFLVLFSAYYLEKLLMVSCDLSEIKRINSKLKMVMDNINIKNGR